jgi:hypothetical protein
MLLAVAGLACQIAACLRLVLKGGSSAPAWALWTWLAGASSILVLALVRRDPVLGLGQAAAVLPVLRLFRRPTASGLGKVAP